MALGPPTRRRASSRTRSGERLSPRSHRTAARGLPRLAGLVIALTLSLSGAGLRQIEPSTVAPAALAEDGPTPDVPAEPVDGDGDGVADDADNCPGIANADQLDADGNGIGDACDAPPPPPDSDGDGIGDAIDNCTLVPNADQIDGNLNGIGDVCEVAPPTDSDGDGLEDGADNCPATANGDQADGDGDGLGDACDPADPAPSPTPEPSAPPSPAPDPKARPTPAPIPYEDSEKYATGGADVPGVAFPYPAPFAVSEDVYPVVARINAGGGEVTIADQVWTADADYRGGTSIRHGRRAVDGTDADSLFRDQRTGTDSGEGFSYQIPVPAAGPYLVRLSFAELSRKDGAPLESGIGKRVMNVNLEGGDAELATFDIAVAGGLAAAVVVPVQVDVVDGVLNIDFGASRARPVISAIEVLRIPSGEHWVDVNRTTNEVHLMIGDVVVATYHAMMSPGPGDATSGTVAGSYVIHNKHVGLLYTPYAHNYFAYWASFDPGREVGFHSWVTDMYGNVVPGGDGYTLGCIATSIPDSAAIWSFLEVGMRVEVHW